MNEYNLTLLDTKNQSISRTLVKGKTKKAVLEEYSQYSDYKILTCDLIK